MGRKYLNPKLRKISLTLSVPFHIWELAKAEGSKKVVELISLGSWANKHSINELTLNKMKEDYEAKIVKLQSRLEKAHSRLEWKDA